MSRQPHPRRTASTQTPLTYAGTHDGPEPVVHPETETHWKRLGAGTLVLQRCGKCGLVRYPLAPVCWRCVSDDYEWVPVATKGTVRVATIVTRGTGDPRWAQQTPYVVALVELDDGPRIPGRVICPPTTNVSAGTRIELGYLTTPNGNGVHCFIPLEADS
ncbi:Zn-ribbon domain-containing OB-fold protein [Nocardioides cheoyonin]|uniref:Zn-ribbon domain-containing OB-fold protein n=1 Tax=Nocardioides cheoyonin TaxID=3156615 RepID=UPI0032B3459F